jgi:hypothetical protein
MYLYELWRKDEIQIENCPKNEKKNLWTKGTRTRHRLSRVPSNSGKNPKTFFKRTGGI